MSRLRHAMILAAGLGTRLRPFTDERPKPLIDVLARPLLEYSLMHAVRAGAERIVINTHWLHPQIPEQLGERFGDVQLRFSHEPEVLGTGGGIKRMSRQLDLSWGPALILNADALIDLDIDALLATHFSTDDRLATLVLKRVPDATKYGAIGTDAQGRVKTFAGRTAYDGPVAEERMFCGVHVIEPQVLDWLSDEAPCCINKVGYPRILDEGHSVLSADHRGAFWDVGTPERLLGANLGLLAGDATLHQLDAFAGLTDRGDRVFVADDAIVADDAALEGPALIASGARVGAGARVGPGTVIGRGAVVEPGAHLERAVVLGRASVAGAVFSSIVGPTATVAAEPEAV
jgi:NDP-sugar pyrophosphorylase family protein